jgi:hypothetical protein
MSEKIINRRIAKLEQKLHDLEISGPRKYDQESITQGNQTLPWWRRFGWWNFVTRIGILGGIGYAIVTYIQWRDLRRNFEAEQRAWVTIDYRWPPHLPNPPDQTAGSIQPILTNIGKSVISRIVVKSTLEILAAADAPSFNRGKAHSTADESPLFPTAQAFLYIYFADQKRALVARLHQMS